jgi:hypothetical protein
MPNLEGKEHIVRWGTATIGVDGIIKLHVVGMPAPIEVRLNPAIILGRADKDNASEMCIDLTLFGAAEQGVSRQHACLELLNKTVMLTDLGSTNGTFLNDQRIMPQQRRVVRDNDEIRLGRLVMHIYF